MTERYIYTDKIGAGPEHPKKRWGLFSTEITPERAAARYGLDAAERGELAGEAVDGAEDDTHAAFPRGAVNREAAREDLTGAHRG